MKNYTITHMIMAMVLAYCMAALSLVWIQMTISPPPYAPAVQWYQSTPWPDRPLCPGEVIRYNSTTRINEAGGLYIYSAIRRAADHPDVLAVQQQAPDVWAAAVAIGGQIVGDTVIPAQNVFRTAFLPDEIPAVVTDLDTAFTVPDLPPGPYVRVTVAGIEGRNARQATHAQPFTIAEDCPR